MSGSWRVAAATVGLLASALAQGDDEAAALRQAVSDLPVPSRTIAATDRLLDAGPRAVPVLLACVRDGRHGESGSGQGFAVAAAVRVLGKLGAGATLALDDVRRCYGYGALRVRNEAMWAMATIAGQSRSATACDDALRWLDLQRTEDLDGFTFEAACARLLLGAKGDLLAALRLRVDDDGVPWSWGSAGTLHGVVAAFADGTLQLPPVLVAELRRQLAIAVMRQDLPWYERDWYRADGGALAAAFAARGEPCRGDIALGLLQHEDPRQRRRGAVALGRDATLSCADRLAIVEMLWDPTPMVEDAARQALVDSGAAGLVGLRALRAFADIGGEFGAPFERAVDAVLRNGDGGDDGVRVLLRELDEAVRGHATGAVSAVPSGPIAAAAPIGAAGAAAIAAVVYGCRGAPADQLERVVAFAARRAPADAAVAVAVLQLLWQAGPDGRARVLALLPKFARGLRATGLDLRWELLLATRQQPSDDRSAELAALVSTTLGPDASRPELLAAIGGGNARLVVAAVAALAARRTPAIRELAAAAAATRARAGEWPFARPMFGLGAAGDVERWDQLHMYGGISFQCWGDASVEFDLALAVLDALAHATPRVPVSAVPLAQRVWAEQGLPVAAEVDVGAWLRRLDADALAAVAAALENHTAAAAMAQRPR